MGKLSISKGSTSRKSTSKKYTASTTLSWKRIHRCCNCDSEYGYRVTRSVSGSGATEVAANIALVSAKNSLLARKNEVCDQVACPTCGFLQPEMYLEKFRGVRWASYFGAIAAIVFLLAAFVVSFDASGGNYEVVYWCRRVAGLLFLLPLITYFWGIMGCSNRNPQKNLEKTQKREDLILLTVGTPPFPGEEKQLSRRYVHVFFATLFLVIFAFLIPTLHEATLSSDRANPNCAPKYFGPGDQVKIYFPYHFSSIKGYWDTRSISATLTGEEKETPVTTHPHHGSWGNNISGKKSELRESKIQLFTELTVPKEEERAGKDVNVRFSMSVEYPAMADADSFVDQTNQYDFDHTIKLSATGTGTQIIKMEFYSFMAAMILFLVHFFLPMISIRRLRSEIANPSEFVIPDDAQEIPGQIPNV